MMKPTDQPSSVPKSHSPLLSFFFLYLISPPPHSSCCVCVRACVCVCYGTSFVLSFCVAKLCRHEPAARRPATKHDRSGVSATAYAIMPPDFHSPFSHPVSPILSLCARYIGGAHALLSPLLLRHPARNVSSFLSSRRLAVHGSSTSASVQNMSNGHDSPYLRSVISLLFLNNIL